MHVFIGAMKMYLRQLRLSSRSDFVKMLMDFTAAWLWQVSSFSHQPCQIATFQIYGESAALLRDLQAFATILLCENECSITVADLRAELDGRTSRYSKVHTLTSSSRRRPGTALSTQISSNKSKGSNSSWNLKPGCMTYAEKVSGIPRQDGKDMLEKKNLRWKTNTSSPCISWTDSLLQALQHAVREHTRREDSEPDRDVQIYVLDTSKISNMVFFLPSRTCFGSAEFLMRPSMSTVTTL